MTTKIDISSLDEYTKNRIEKLGKRCSELSDGVEIVVNLTVKYNCYWTEGESCVIEEWEPNRAIDWDFVNKQEEEFRQKIDEEIKDIVDFSNSVADRLGVDRDEMRVQYFEI